MVEIHPTSSFISRFYAPRENSGTITLVTQDLVLDVPDAAWNKKLPQVHAALAAVEGVTDVTTTMTGPSRQGSTIQIKFEGEKAYTGAVDVLAGIRDPHRGRPVLADDDKACLLQRATAPAPMFNPFSATANGKMARRATYG